MKRLLSTLLCTAAFTQAAVLVELDPVNGQISGPEGTTIGWGFTITSDTHFLILNGIDFLPAPSMGVFNDMISFRPTLFVVGPGPGENPVRSEVFDLLAETGLASFAIDAGIPVGTTAIGTIFFNYSLYTVSPNDPLFDPGIHTFDAGLTIPLAAQITVIAAPPPSGVPEPSTFALGSLALGALLWRRRCCGARVCRRGGGGRG